MIIEVNLEFMLTFKTSFFKQSKELQCIVPTLGHAVAFVSSQLS